MRFSLTEEQRHVREQIAELTAPYDEEYWRDVRKSRRFPQELYDDLADSGWLGVMFPEEYGGKGMGVVELAIAMEELARRGAWSTGAVGGAIFGGLSVLANGTPEQQEKYLRGIMDGDTWALGLTEPDAGVNTPNISTVATNEDDGYVLEGQKKFIGAVDHASWMLVLARTTPLAEVESPFRGLTMFIVDPQHDDVDYSEIDVDIYWPHRIHDVSLDGAVVDESQVLGEVDKGLYQIFDTLNVERIGTAAQIWGTGQWLLDRSVEYANERQVWSEPIGAHQAIQHPLAKAHTSLQASKLVIEKAGWCYDTDDDAVVELSNVANYLAGQAAWEAAEVAMTTFGGRSVMSETGISAAWEYVRHSRTTALPEEMLLNYVGHNVLDLPQSYER